MTFKMQRKMCEIPALNAQMLSGRGHDRPPDGQMRVPSDDVDLCVDYCDGPPWAPGCNALPDILFSDNPAIILLII